MLCYIFWIYMKSISGGTFILQKFHINLTPKASELELSFSNPVTCTTNTDEVGVSGAINNSALSLCALDCRSQIGCFHLLSCLVMTQ